jgi:hypothetical protein
MPLKEPIENNGIYNRDDDDNTNKQVAKEPHCALSSIRLFSWVKNTGAMRYVNFASKPIILLCW